MLHLAVTLLCSTLLLNRVNFVLQEQAKKFMTQQSTFNQELAAAKRGLQEAETSRDNAIAKLDQQVGLPAVSNSTTLLYYCVYSAMFIL